MVFKIDTSQPKNPWCPITYFFFKVGEWGMHGWSVIWIFMDLDHCLNVTTPRVARFWIIYMVTSLHWPWIAYIQWKLEIFWGHIYLSVWCSLNALSTEAPRMKKIQIWWGQRSGSWLRRVAWQQVSFILKVLTHQFHPQNGPVQTQMPRRTSPIRSPKHLHETMCLKLHHACGIKMCLFGNWRGATVSYFMFLEIVTCTYYLNKDIFCMNPCNKKFRNSESW